MCNLEKVKCVKQVCYRFIIDNYYYYKLHSVKLDNENIWEIYDDYKKSYDFLLVSDYAFRNYFKTKYQLRKEKLSKLLNEVNI